VISILVLIDVIICALYQVLSEEDMIDLLKEADEGDVLLQIRVLNDLQILQLEVDLIGVLPCEERRSGEVEHVGRFVC